MADMEVDKVADMEADKMADIEVDMVADIEVDTVADMEVDMVADININININMEIKFGERVGHGGWLIGPKLLDPKLTRFAHLLSFASLLYKREIAQGGQTFLDLVRSNILQKFLISRRKDTVAKKRGGKNDK